MNHFWPVVIKDMDAVLKTVKRCQARIEDESSTSHEILHAMYTLYTVPVNTAVLHATGIGQTMTGIKRTYSGAVRRNAEALLVKWKAIVAREQVVDGDGTILIEKFINEDGEQTSSDDDEEEEPLDPDVEVEVEEDDDEDEDMEEEMEIKLEAQLEIKLESRKLTMKLEPKDEEDDDDDDDDKKSVDNSKSKESSGLVKVKTLKIKLKREEHPTAKFKYAKRIAGIMIMKSEPVSDSDSKDSIDIKSDLEDEAGPTSSADYDTPSFSNPTFSKLFLHFFVKNLEKNFPEVPE